LTAAPVASHVSILELLIRSGRLGAVLSDVMKSALKNPELSDNVSVVILCELTNHGACRPVQLQRLLDLSSSRITRAVDKLESLGLVRREYGVVADDRRGTVITLTPAGASELAAVIAAIERQAEQVRRLTWELAQVFGSPEA
jgi:DNA-binding MarR family transcriptional regulator